MRYGVAMFTTDYSVDPATLAGMVEERGFESLFFPEHTHIPASRETPYPAGGELPKEYSHLNDPFISLGAAAAVTETLLLGTGICLVAQRDPIITAKEVATIDRLSGGRFLFGVGAGWNREETANHGTDPRRRFSLMRERVEAMKAIWTEEEATYKGEHVEFERIWSWPKPVQRPHPPVLVGGNGEKVLERVVAVGDEWMPNPFPGLRDRIADLQQLAAEAGRGQISVTLNAARPDPDFAERGEQAGIHRCLTYVQPGDAGEVERQLDELAGTLALSGKG